MGLIEATLSGPAMTPGENPHQSKYGCYRNGENIDPDRSGSRYSLLATCTDLYSPHHQSEE